MQTEKWSETSDLIIAVLKVFSTNLLVMVWPIAVAVFLVTLVGLLLVGTHHFDITNSKNLWLSNFYHNLWG